MEPLGVPPADEAIDIGEQSVCRETPPTGSIFLVLQRGVCRTHLNVQMYYGYRRMYASGGSHERSKILRRSLASILTSGSALRIRKKS